jgi:hypothetical protein
MPILQVKKLSLREAKQIIGDHILLDSEDISQLGLLYTTILHWMG